MPTNMAAELLPLLPEIWMAVACMFLLLAGAFGGDRSTRLIEIFAVWVCVIALIFVWQGERESVTVLNAMLTIDDYGRYFKTLILIASMFTIVMSWVYIEKEKIGRPEYPVLVLFATLGMMLMVSANDLLALYVGVELQSLALYVLASFKRDHARSSEAGLKYFVLGALSSGIMLYGISLIYGFAGGLGFDALKAMYAAPSVMPLGLVVGMVFLLAGLAFKVSAVPFHMWAPDVYEGAPTPITAFFASAPKLAGMALLAKVLFIPLAASIGYWQQMLWLLALATMIVGGFAAIRQTNIKRMMAYSSIGHVGYALIALVCGTQDGLHGLLIYMAIYFINTLGAFAVILCLRRKGEMVEQIQDFSGLSKVHPILAASMVVFMFSMAGVPPLAGFFGKFYVFLAAVESGHMFLAIVGVLMSAVSAYYYLRIIKLMYFDDTPSDIDAVPEYSLRVALGVAAAYMLLFCVFPNPVIQSAQHAVNSLGVF